MNMRRLMGGLLACIVLAAAACGTGSPTPSRPSQHTANASNPSAPSGSPSPTPVQSPTISIPTAGNAWTAKSAAITDLPGEGGTVEAHLGANYPLTLTGKSASVVGVPWFEATWQSPSRKGTGWLPASLVTNTKPTAGTSAGFDALDSGLTSYLTGLGTRVGVDAFDVTRGVTYTYNAGLAYFVASSVKVPIMLTFLWQLEAKKKEPSSTQRSLLTTMIENSNNNSATALYKAIGYQNGIKAFMRSVGISGLSPATPVVGWGLSTITPACMVALLTKLNNGTVLNDDHREFALYLMRHIDSNGRVGVGDSSPAGATIAMKDGWYGPIDDPSGPWVVNSSGIVTLGAETYIVSIYTDHDKGSGEGYTIVRHVAKSVGVALMGTP